MPNEELREKNRREVLSQAIQCFIELGIESSTLGVIASRSGVTMRSILRYYQTKDNLVEQVIGEIMKTTYSSLHGYIDSEEYAGLTGMEQLMGVFDRRAKYTRENPQLILCLAELEIYFTKRMKNIEVYRRYYSYFGFLSDVVKSALEKGRDDGTIKKSVAITVASDLIAIAYKGLLQRMSLIYANSELVKEYDPDALIASFRELIVAQLLP